MLKICNVCGNRLVTQFSRVCDPITNEAFSIQKCAACGLGHTLPQPHNLSRYYGTVYYGNRHGFTFRYCMRRRLNFVSSITDACTNKKLLDIGCGDGSFMLAAKKAGWKVTGTEIAPELARSFGLDVKEIIEQIPHDSLFDCITMWHSLEHMRDVRATLSQLSQMVKQNGQLIIAIPDNGGLQANFFRHKWLHLDVPRHLYHFNSGSLALSLKRAGFTIQKQWHQELEYDLMGWSQSILNCFFSDPNTFIDYLTGKANGKGRLLTISNFVLGLIITATSLIGVVIGTLSGRGGTLIIAARRNI